MILGLPIESNLDKRREERIEVHGEIQLQLDIIVAELLLNLRQVVVEQSSLEVAESDVPLEDVILYCVGGDPLAPLGLHDGDEVVDEDAGGSGTRKHLLGLTVLQTGVMVHLL